MRVIAGTFRSRQLKSLPGLDIRPTSDRLRETLFDVLTAGNPDALAGTQWLDLFAGTGAVGIEALSRGASQVCFVESSREAAELIRQNLRSLGVATGYQVLNDAATRALRALERSDMRPDFVFLDPPYRMEKTYAETLQALSASPLIGASCVVIVEHQKRFDPADEAGALHRTRKITQADAALTFYRKL